jgi:alpha/beta superfamily hydrolase
VERIIAVVVDIYYYLDAQFSNGQHNIEITVEPNVNLNTYTNNYIKMTSQSYSLHKAYIEASHFWFRKHENIRYNTKSMTFVPELLNCVESLKVDPSWQ